MRFISKAIEFEGQSRIQSWFAFWPVKIGNEVRWLEKVTVKWIVGKRHRFLPPCAPYFTWVKYEFIDEMPM